MVGHIRSACMGGGAGGCRSRVYSLFVCSAYDDPPVHGTRLVISSFWTSMAPNPLLRGHPLKARRDWARCTIPLSLHGDTVPVTGVGKRWTKAADVYSWNSLVGQGPTKLCNYYIFSIFQRLISTYFNAGTKTRLWRVLKWSFDALMTGRFPTHDAWGKEFRGGLDGARAGTALTSETDFYCGVLWIIRADLDFWSAEFLLPRHNSAASPCPFCPGRVGAGQLHRFQKIAITITIAINMHR